MLVELLCLLVFGLRLVHYARVIPRDKFWKDPKNICIIAIVTVGGAYLPGYTIRCLDVQEVRCEDPCWLVADYKPLPFSQLVSTVTPAGFSHFLVYFPDHFLLWLISIQPPLTTPAWLMTSSEGASVRLPLCAVGPSVSC